jgi:hypothetical protein
VTTVTESSPIGEPEPAPADSDIDKISLMRLTDDIADMAVELAERKHLSISDAVHVVGVGFSLLLIPQPAPPPMFIDPSMFIPMPEGPYDDIPDNLIPFPTPTPEEA